MGTLRMYSCAVLALQCQRHVREAGEDCPLSFCCSSPSFLPFSILFSLTSVFRDHSHASQFLAFNVLTMLGLPHSSFYTILTDFPLHPNRVSSVGVYVTYVFDLFLHLCLLGKAGCHGGCLKPALVTAAAEEIKWACVSRQCCRFISLLTGLILLPIHWPPLDPITFSLYLPLAVRDQPLSVCILTTINLSHCSIKLLRA